MRKVLGLMSGSSLDGLDMCLLDIQKQNGKWGYNVIKAETVKYPKQISTLLQSMSNLNIFDYLQADRKYTTFICQNIMQFITGHNVDLISSHGHTIFHQPQKGITLQCGDPVMIAALTKINTVGNFRQLDVFRGGQGAPLVPFGYQLLQNQNNNIDVYLNLGGICNIDANGKGWDIGFCNLFSNMMVSEISQDFDNDGELGKSGKVDIKMLQLLKQQTKTDNGKYQKSFGREHFYQFLRELKLQQLGLPLCDRLRTYYEYLAQLIIKNVHIICNLQGIQKNKVRILCSGGGALNKFLIQLLNRDQNLEFLVPNRLLVQFKEAIVFAFLGIKYLDNIPNCSNGIGGVLAKGKISEK